jgi:uncharacterized membrane protein
MRIYMNKPILIFLGLALFYTLSNFLAPALMEPGTVDHIDGTGTLDHRDQWRDLNIYAHAIYLFGDSQCHQMEHRSYHIHGNQMPLCARCMALFLWAPLGLVTAMLVRPEYDISVTSVKLYPRRMRRAILRKNLVMLSWCLLCVLCVLPTAIDGFYQLLTPYESTNINRVLFSIPTGWFGGLAFGLMFNNVHYNIYGKDDDDDEDPEMVEDMEIYWGRKRALYHGPYVAPIRHSPKDDEEEGGVPGSMPDRGDGDEEE